MSTQSGRKWIQNYQRKDAKMADELDFIQQYRQSKTAHMMDRIKKLERKCSDLEKAVADMRAWAKEKNAEFKRIKK